MTQNQHSEEVQQVDAVGKKVNLLTNLYNIDREQDAPIHREVNKNDDAQSYVDKLINDSQENPNKRFYHFTSDSSPIYSSIISFFTQKNEGSIETLFNFECKKIADRLLRAEKNTADTYPGIRPPKRGSLITTMEQIDSDLRLTIAKIETEEFLDDIDLKLLSGLPYNKKALKTAIINVTLLEDDELHIDITVTDTNSTISKYWTTDFLEVTEVVGDAKNTLNSFTEIEKVISKSLKTKSPADYTELRNNLVGYFKTQSSFQLENMIEYVFGDYQIENEDIKIDDIRGKVKDLATKQKFDTHFDIISKEIKARFRRTYKVTNDIEIRTNGHIEGLKHMIHSAVNAKGEKVLEIKIEDEKIFQQFNFDKKTEENID
ncbi:hypothetical protein SporoP37_15665 [Sporosarcina sp. P37]|nr:hypothetical protein [Sporosarcina sp. P35]ARK25966.1 hypothetical protein SporoP37_15665 [Sporosarcina sp. P37]PID19333.1 hypothetical protein CSV62_02185 [Sporosarcina sp. P35]